MKALNILILIIIIFIGCTKQSNTENETNPVVVKKVDSSELLEGDENSEETATPTQGIIGIQYAFYRRTDWTPLYSNIHNELFFDTWIDMVQPINKELIGYDGFGGLPKWLGIDRLRFQFMTKLPGEEIIIYLDDIRLHNSDKTILNLDFENSDGAFWQSKGQPGENMATFQIKEGRKYFQIHGYSETKYSSTGVEIDFTIPEVCNDLGSEEYILRYKYYIPSTKD